MNPLDAEVPVAERADVSDDTYDDDAAAEGEFWFAVALPSLQELWDNDADAVYDTILG